MRDVVLDELCKADQAQSVFILPAGGDLRQRICAASRLQLMEFALDLYRYINRSMIQRQVSKWLTFYRCERLIVISVYSVQHSSSAVN